MNAPRRPVDDNFLLTGSTLGDSVDIGAPVAVGNFGLVYRGRHRALNLPVAVKVLRMPRRCVGDAEEWLCLQLAQDGQAVCEFAHPAIARLVGHSVGRVPTGEMCRWMAWEWLDGVTLDAARRARGSPMHITEALALLRPVIEALAAAHARGLCHRDVTSNNILLSETTDGPRGRLADFGVACVKESYCTLIELEDVAASRRTAYAPHHGAPEQCARTRMGPWTDVHALGLIVTELVAGCDAYQGRDPAELCHSAMSPQRPTPAQKGVDVGAFEPVLAKAIALHPRDRYPNAGELLDALDAVDTNEPPRPSQRR